MKNFYKLLTESITTNFYEEFFANPKDYNLILIFSDWLTEQGDPLGELIRMILERKKNKRGTKRKLNAAIASLLPLFKNSLRVYTYTLSGPGTISFVLNGDNYTYYPNGYKIKHSHSYMRQGEWMEKNIPPRTLVRTPEVPYAYQYGGEENKNPKNPRNWEFPFDGNHEEMTDELRHQILVGMILEMV